MVKNSKIALTLNVVLALAGALCIYLKGFYFQYYLDLAICLSVISSLLFVINIILKKEQKALPFYLIALRFVSTVGLFASLVLALISLFYYMEMYFILIIIVAVLFVVSYVSFVYFEADRRLNRKSTIYYAFVPTLIYVVVCVVLGFIGKPIYNFLVLSFKKDLINILFILGLIVLTYFVSKFILIQNQKHTPRRIRK